jgi:hypothetical protein
MKPSPFVLLLALGVLVGAPAHAAEADKPDNGDMLLSGAVGIEPFQMVVYVHRLDAKGSGTSPLIQPWNMFMTADYHAAGPTPEEMQVQLSDKTHAVSARMPGQIGITHLPAGKYEVYKISVSNMTYSGHKFFFVRKISVPFEIQPGNTTYVGSFEAAPTVPERPLKTLFGNELAQGIRIFHRDAHERDVALARAKKPILGELSVQVADATMPAQDEYAPLP